MEDAAAKPRGARDSDGSSKQLVLVLPLLAYVVGFIAYFPDVLTVADEAHYVRQAVAFASGRVEVEHHEAVGGRSVWVRPSSYPVGTSAIMVPFVLLLGWRGAFLVPLLALVAAVLLTARWLAAEGKPSWYALLVLTYPPALVLGRVAMSDVLSAAWMAGVLLCFWLGARSCMRRVRYWFAAGLLGGTSLLLREPNVLVAAPFFAGALIRRDRGAFALLLGGAAGVALRLSSASWVFDDVLFVKHVSYGFGLDAFIRNAPLYAIASGLFVPTGLICALRYRGPRWPELVVTTLSFLGFYCAYEYSGRSSGVLKGLVLGPRFMLPLVPLLAYAVGHVSSDWLERRAAGSSSASATAARLLPRAYAAAAVVACLAVHVGMDAWNAGQRAIRDAIYEHTPERGLIATNLLATRKFVNELYGERRVVDRRVLASERGNSVLGQTGSEAHLVLLHRSDSAHWRRHAAEDIELLARIRTHHRLTTVLDAALTPTDRLRIWRIDPRAHTRSRPR